MNSKNTECRGCMGRLPAKAPLANPFVPFQNESPPMYEPRKAVVRGTLYQGLDLPFMDLVNNKELNITPKTELQTLAFMVQELALYLDTHREDKEALEMYQAYQRMYHQATMEYGRQYGPMSHQCPSEGEYRWLDDPWPWEFCANKEA